MKEHILKCDKEIYDRVRSGEKTFDIRKDDRHFQTGDKVTLDPHRTNDGPFPMTAPAPPGYGEPTRTPLSFTIGFVLRGGQFGLEPGYVAFSLIGETVPDCTDPNKTWIQHDGSNYTPPGAMSRSIIEVVANGDTREKSHSMHPSNVKWNNIKEWRHVK